MSALFKIVEEGARGAFTVLDYIELIIIVCFGTALFGAAIWSISKAIIENGSKLYLGLFGFFVIISVGSIVRDIMNKRFGALSKCFLVCWGVCVLYAGWILSS